MRKMMSTLGIAAMSLALAACQTTSTTIGASEPRPETALKLESNGRLLLVKNPGELPGAFYGALYVPPERKLGTRIPAVIFVHGTSGVDSRYNFHREAMVKARIAVFELDLKTGVYNRLKDAPPSTKFQSAAFAALKRLRQDYAIDPDRVAFMGFSLGGNMAMQLASSGIRDRYMKGGPGFAAFLSFYGGCDWVYDREKSLNSKQICSPVRDDCRFEGEPTGKPMYILTAELDSYGDGKTCQGFAEVLNKRSPGMVKLKIYPGAYHAFDKEGVNWSGSDNYSSSIVAKYDEKVALDSRKEAVAFLRRVFGME